MKLKTGNIAIYNVSNIFIKIKNSTEQENQHATFAPCNLAEQEQVAFCWTSRFKNKNCNNYGHSKKNNTTSRKNFLANLLNQ